MFSALFKSSHTIDINLLPKDPFASSPVGKFLNWALSVGRYIVVFTELIVILTFFSRFTLDRQLTDLNEAILEKQSLLEGFATTEAKVRQIQDRAEFVTKLTSETNLSTGLAYILKNLPKDITFDNIHVSPEDFIITGISSSQVALSDFINTLKSDPQFSEVNVNQLKTGGLTPDITFVIEAKYKTASLAANQ